MFTVPVKCTAIQEYEDCYFIHLTAIPARIRASGFKNNEIVPLYIPKIESHGFKVGDEYLLAITSKV